MENDSPNLFDSEPISVNLTVTESNKDVDMINKTNDDDTLNIENINESNPNEEQNESEYHTDEFDEENDSDNHIENQLNNSDKSIDQSIEPQEEHSSKNKTKDVHKGLPYGRVKLIMKMDPDVNIVAGDAVFLVTKATVSTPNVILNKF